MYKEKALYIIAGPTGVGKTALGIELAKRIDGEIISADSMQVYRHMDVGTAKITESQMQGIKHHMIDILEPDEPFSVAKFAEMAKEIIEDIYSRNKTPIIVGGTGFYIQALLYDIDFTEHEEDSVLRDELNEIAINEGPEVLHHILEEIDPKAANDLHVNDIKRVIRAIEFYKKTGTKISDHNVEQREKKSPYNYFYFVVNDDRKLVYERIDERVDEMILEGLVDEVKKLLDMGYTSDMVSMQGIGYKQLIAYYNGEYDYDEAVRLIKRDSRHFAKRQITWFNREKEIYWIDKREYPTMDSRIERILEVSGNN